MTKTTLSGRRVLVVEDEYFIATDIVRGLSQAGAIIVGPVATLSDTMLRIERGGLDFAILNIRLQDGLVFPAADRLRLDCIPFLFLTGYDQNFIPGRFSSVRLCQKPHSNNEIIEFLLDLVNCQF